MDKNGETNGNHPPTVADLHRVQGAPSENYTIFI